MDILRNLFGNLTSGIIRLLVTVGILAAAYFFIVKPVLKTTDNAISHEANQTSRRASNQANLGDIDKTIEDVNRQVQREITQSFHAAKQQGNADKLVRCIQHAHRTSTGSSAARRFQ